MAPGLQAVPLHHIRVMRLQPGDVVVLTVDRALSEQECVEEIARLKPLFPDHKVIVLHGGVTLSFAREVKD